MKKKASTALQEIAMFLKPFPCFFVLSLRVDAEISTRSMAREGAKRREKAITLASAAASNQYFLFVGFLSFFLFFLRRPRHPLLTSSSSQTFPPSSLFNPTSTLFLNQVTASASFSGDLGLDSLDAVELVMALEEEFGIEIPDAEADKLSSTAEAISYLAAHPQAK